MMASSTAPEEPPSCYWRLCLYGFNSQDEEVIERGNSVAVILEEVTTETSKNGYKQNLNSIYKSIKNKRTKRKQKNVENFLTSKEEEAEYDGDDDSTAASSSDDESCSDDSEEYDDLEQGPSNSTPFHHPHKQNVKLVSILRNPQQKSKKKHFFGKKQKRRRRKHVTWKDGGAQEEEEYEEDDDSEYENPNVTKMIDEWRFAEC